MKKSTKGALAVSAAAVLLLGGGGTLAYWTDTETVEGGSITHGTLALTPTGADCTTTTWYHADGGTVSTDDVALVVPGDQIGKTCTYTVAATGDHLAATLVTPTTATYTAPDGSTFDAIVSASYTLNGAGLPAGGAITSANDAQQLVATILVDIPFGTVDGNTDATVDQNQNDTQGDLVAINDIAVTLTQTDHN